MPQFGFKFISGKYQGAEYPIPDEGELIVGRSSELDLVLVEDMVSRKHAKLTAAAGALTLLDLGSTNGTFVNGEKIRRATLKKNDRILIGTSILKVIPGAEMTVDGSLDKAGLRSLMEEIGNKAPSVSTMSGDLEEVPLPDLLQLFATNKRSGILSINGPKRGKVYMKGGQLRYAVIGGEVQMRPMKALCRMVGWAKGQFQLEPFENAETEQFPETFQESTESVLMEALRQLDELRRLMNDMPKPEAHLALCTPLTPKLADLNKIELDTLQLVINFNTLKTVLDKTEHTDFEAATAMLRLMRDGYLEVEENASH
jgi:pSer/pThr/pTyr-binding forkhead associated (FHA) protein